MDPATIGLALTAASKAFGAIKKGFAIGKDIESMLDGPVCHDGFKRLN